VAVRRVVEEVFLIVMCFIGLIAIVVLLNTQQVQKETYVYIGKLVSITYIHQGWLGSISDTVLHFENKTDFVVSGHHVYQIGATLKVTYEIEPVKVVSVEVVENG